MFTRKDYDYSKRARFKHAQNLAQMDQAALSGKRISIGQIETERHQKISEHAVMLLARVLASTSLEQRIKTWQDFKSWIHIYRLEVVYSDLKKMINMYNHEKIA